MAFGLTTTKTIGDDVPEGVVGSFPDGLERPVVRADPSITDVRSHPLPVRGKTQSNPEIRQDPGRLSLRFTTTSEARSRRAARTVFGLTTDQVSEAKPGVVEGDRGSSRDEPTAGESFLANEVMLEIISTIVVVMVLVIMARRGRRRRRGVRMLKCSELVTLGTLGAQTAIVTVFDSTVEDSTYLLSIECVYSMSEHAVNEGPIVVGVAHSDYTAAEILEWYQAAGAWDRGDKIAQEHNSRKIRQVGVFPGLVGFEVLNDGRPLKTKLGFMLAPGDTLGLWAINEDNGALTTGTVVEASGKVWAAK